MRFMCKCTLVRYTNHVFTFVETEILTDAHKCK